MSLGEGGREGEREGGRDGEMEGGRKGKGGEGRGGERGREGRTRQSESQIKLPELESKLYVHSSKITF